MKRVIVTGGAGFIGSQLVRDLLQQGYFVKVIDDLSSGKRENLQDIADHSHFEFVQGCITEQNFLKKELTGFEGVFHLACSHLRESLADPERAHRVNGTGTLMLLMACLEKKINRFLYVSTSEVYGSAQYGPMDESHPTNPHTVYASSKLVGEYYTLNFCRLHGLNATVIRPFNNFGPRSHYENKNGELIPRSAVYLLNDQPPRIFGNGQQTRDFLYVADTSRGLIAAYESDKIRGEILNLASGVETSVRSVVDKLCDLIGKNISAQFTKVDRPGDVSRLWADVKKVQDKLNWKPQEDLGSGLKKYLEWLENQDKNTSSMIDEIQEMNW